VYFIQKATFCYSPQQSVYLSIPSTIVVCQLHSDCYNTSQISALPRYKCRTKLHTWIKSHFKQLASVTVVMRWHNWCIAASAKPVITDRSFIPNWYKAIKKRITNIKLSTWKCTVENKHKVQPNQLKHLQDTVICFCKNLQCWEMMLHCFSHIYTSIWGKDYTSLTITYFTKLCLHSHNNIY